MSESENQDSGTKPPPPPPRDDSRLPPRLREKLEEADEEPTQKSPVVGWIVGLLVVVVVVAAGWWFVHDRQVKAEAERAARAAAVADSIAKVRTADNLVAVARADSIAAFNALPKSKQRQILAGLARAEQIETDYVFSWRPNPAQMVCVGFDEKNICQILRRGLEDASGNPDRHAHRMRGVDRDLHLVPLPRPIRRRAGRRRSVEVPFGPVD